MKYVALLRGINVGGKNRVPMVELKACFEELGHGNVKTYINSGNVVFESDKNQEKLAAEISADISNKFALESELIEVLVLSQPQVQQVLDQAPKGFGTEPDKYHTDIIFLIGVDPSEAFKVFKPREGVDKVWQGNLAIYSQRLSAERTKSRLSAIMASPLYKKMTIRTYGTVRKLLDLLEA